MSETIQVIIADDHQIVRQGLRMMLEADASIEIVGEAENGQEALELIAKLRPQVALLDISMGEPDGLEIAKQCRDNNFPIEIVLLTMHREESIFNDALDVGVKGYVLKESAAHDIVKAIKAVTAGDHFASTELANFVMNRMSGVQQLREEKPGLNDLTKSERRILKLIASDRTSKEIAAELGLSPRTVDAHRANMSTKLGLSGSHSLVKFAFENRSKL